MPVAPASCCCYAAFAVAAAVLVGAVVVAQVVVGAVVEQAAVARASVRAAVEVRVLSRRNFASNRLRPLHPRGNAVSAFVCGVSYTIQNAGLALWFATWLWCLSMPVLQVF